MNIEVLAQKLDFKLVSGGLSGEASGVYAGDFLSRAMSRVSEGDLWITIMNNINVIAVASLTEAAAVILAEGVTLDEAALKAAQEKEITVFTSERTAYELCRDISQSIL